MFCIWSTYQIHHTKSKLKHNGKVLKKNFNKKEFMRDVNVFGKKSNGDRTDFQYWLLGHEMMEYYKSYWDNDESKILHIRYEDMIDPNKRIDEIYKILNFLYKDFKEKNEIIVPTANNKDSEYKILSGKNLLCEIKNSITFAGSISALKRDHKNEHNANFTSQFMSGDDVWHKLTQNEICAIWNEIKIYAKPLGYQQVRKEEFDCEGYLAFSNKQNRRTLELYNNKLTNYSLIPMPNILP